MDCGEVRRLAGREVPDRQFQLDADPPRARTAQRGEEALVKRGGYGIVVSHVGYWLW